MLVDFFLNRLNRYLSSLTNIIDSDIDCKYSFISKSKKAAMAG